MDAQPERGPDPQPDLAEPPTRPEPDEGDAPRAAGARAATEAEEQPGDELDGTEVEADIHETTGPDGAPRDSAEERY